MLRLGETRRAVASLPGDGSNGVVSAIMLGSEMLRLGNARNNVVRPRDDDVDKAGAGLRILLGEIVASPTVRLPRDCRITEIPPLHQENPTVDSNQSTATHTRKVNFPQCPTWLLCRAFAL